MLIIAGSLEVVPNDRDDYVAACKEIVESARSAEGCLDFTISADPVDPARVNVYERWESVEEVEAFRGTGPDPGLSDRIVGADVVKFRISGTEDP